MISICSVNVHTIIYVLWSLRVFSYFYILLFYGFWSPQICSSILPFRTIFYLFCLTLWQDLSLSLYLTFTSCAASASAAGSGANEKNFEWCRKMMGTWNPDNPIVSLTWKGRLSHRGFREDERRPVFTFIIWRFFLRHFI